MLSLDRERPTNPKRFYLYPNYPNPFKSHTEFNFGVSEGVNVNFVIYNLAGEKVRSLINNKYFESGSYNFYWDARDDCGRRLSAGVYLYVFELKSKNETKRLVEKIVLLK